MADANTNLNAASNSAAKLNTHDLNAMAGAMFFVVGRGTEGGSASYRMSITGISDRNWGKVGDVIQDSGYSFGTIQIDLGKRGEWALGAVDGAKPKQGETTYVDGIIDQASQYAKAQNLKFTADTKQLRDDLLTHGNGEKNRDSVSFVDKGTRDSINAWAGSPEGQQWIHKNIDYPQVKNATKTAMDMLDTHGKNIAEEHRLETTAILAKTANQYPGYLQRYETVLKNGGDYETVVKKADELHGNNKVYHGVVAGNVAKQYQQAFSDPAQAEAIVRAQNKVSSAGFDPSKSAEDPDFRAALKAVGQAPHQSVDITALQTKLTRLEYTGAEGKPLTVNGQLDADTKFAVKTFQHDNHIHADGKPTPATLKAIDTRLVEHQQIAELRATPLFQQAQTRLRLVDDEHCRRHDPRLDNAAAAMAVSAYKQGIGQIDTVMPTRGGPGSPAPSLLAVQGEPHTVDAKYAQIDPKQALNTPVLDSAKAYEQEKIRHYSEFQHAGPRGQEQGAAPIAPEKHSSLSYDDLLKQPLPANASREEVTRYTFAALMSDDPEVMHTALNQSLNTPTANDFFQRAELAYNQQQAQEQAQVQAQTQQANAPAMRM